jgi:hypothetical protein
MNGDIVIWFPVDPAIMGIFIGVLVIFVVIWVWKLAVSLVTGG